MQTTYHHRSFHQSLSSIRPEQIIKKREPFVWKRSEVCSRLPQGRVIPSDHAFVDVVLDGRLPSQGQWGQCITVETSRDVDGICMESMAHVAVHRHVVLYHGEAVWTFETTSAYNETGTWGQSSTCILTNGKLRVNLHHKGRKATGEGHHSLEKRVYCLKKILKQSGKLRQQEVQQASSMAPRAA